MSIDEIIGVGLPIILGLIGIIYRILSGGVKENKNSIKELDVKTDKRLDDVEKDIVEIKTKQNL